MMSRQVVEVEIVLNYIRNRIRNGKECLFYYLMAVSG
jgi:hypothetical protein